MTDYSEAIQTIAVYAIPVLFAFTMHEVAHGYAARYFGDNTAAERGGLSLNPVDHIDWFGTIILPLILFLTKAGIIIAYPKPTPVDYSRMRNPKKQMGFVAAAGPAANLAMGVAWGLMLIILSKLGVTETFVIEVVKAGVITNAFLCGLNLLPIPMLDGWHILLSVLPIEIGRKLAVIERYGIVVMLAILLMLNTQAFRTLLATVFSFTLWVIQLILSPITYLMT